MRLILAHVSSIARNIQARSPPIIWGANAPIPLGEFLKEYRVPATICCRPANYKLNAPGTGGGYSNIDYPLAGCIVEQVSLPSFGQYCQENIRVARQGRSPYWIEDRIDTGGAVGAETVGSRFSLTPRGFRSWPNRSISCSHPVHITASPCRAI